MDVFLELVIKEALIAIPVLIIMGKFIKETPGVPNWIIPYIILVMGMALTIGIMGLSVDAVIQGVLVSGASVFGNQLWQQAIYKNEGYVKGE